MSLSLVHEQWLSSEKGSNRIAFARTNPILPNPTLIHLSSKASSSTFVPTSLAHVPPNRVPFKCLSPVELQSCLGRGLCYNYGVKFSHSHKYKALAQLLLLTEDLESPAEYPE